MSDSEKNEVSLEEMGEAALDAPTADDSAVKRPAAESQASSRFSVANLVGGSTDVSPFTSLIVGLILAVVYYAVIGMSFVPERFTEMFTKRTWVPYVIILLFFWGMTILAVKLIRLREQKSVLNLNLVPAYLTRISFNDAREILDNLPRRVSHASSKLISRRIQDVLEHYVSGGTAESTGQLARDRADLDSEILESSYSFIKVFIWAVPILGFVGTVIGISEAVSEFSTIIDQAQGIVAIKEALGGVTTGLAVAFETTLVALVVSLIMMFPTSSLQKAEESFLNEAEHYINTRIVAKMERGGGLQADSDFAIRDTLKNINEVFSDKVNVAMERMVENTEEVMKLLDENFHQINQKFSESMAESIKRMDQTGGEDVEKLVEAIREGFDRGYRQMTESLASLEEKAFNFPRANLEAIQEVITQEKDNVEILNRAVRDSIENNTELFGQLEKGLSGYIKTFVAAMSKEEKIISLQNQINQNLTLLTTTDQLQKTLARLNAEVERLAPALQKLSKPVTVRILEEKSVR